MNQGVLVVSQYSTHLDTAHDFYDDGNYEAAKAAAQHAVQCALPTDGNEAKTLYALCLRKLEYNDEAYELLQSIVQSSPSAEACAEFALMRAERNACDDSCREMALRAIHDDPNLPSAYIALFWCDVRAGLPLQAIDNLKRGILRGSEFPESRAFEILRTWCQQYCDNDNPRAAFELTQAVGDLFTTFDFIILQARIADICNEHRIAVHYYKKALGWLRPGQMRLEVLEAIARIAV